MSVFTYFNNDAGHTIIIVGSNQINNRPLKTVQHGFRSVKLFKTLLRMFQ